MPGQLRPIERQVEHGKAHKRVMLDLLQDHTELFKQFSDNPGFNRWLTDTVFNATSQPAEPGSLSPKRGSNPSLGYKCVCVSKFLLRWCIEYEVDAVHTSTCAIDCLTSFGRVLVQVEKPTRTYRFC